MGKSNRIYIVYHNNIILSAADSVTSRALKYKTYRQCKVPTHRQCECCACTYLSTGVWCNTRSGNKRPSFPARLPCYRPCDVISAPTKPRPGKLTFLFPSSSSSSSSSSVTAHTFTRAAAQLHRVTRIEVMITRAPRVVPPSSSSSLSR